MSDAGSELAAQALNPYAQIVAETQAQHQLFSVHWELTYRCNARCSHCYLDVSAPQACVPGELDTHACLRVLDELAALGALNLAFSGGEILVRRDFFEIAAHARVRRFLLRLFTNGTLITPDIAARIAALHPYAVEISLYSVRAETHERITRGAHQFAATVRAFQLLREHGVRTVMKTPLMRENVREFRALKTFAEELGAQFRYDLTITPKDGGRLDPLRHALTFADLVWFFREILEPASWEDSLRPFDQPTCNIASNALVLDPFGTVFPCVQTRIALGNVRVQSLQTIWRESPGWKELSNLILGQLPFCAYCRLNSLCVRCHGLARLETGDLRAPAFPNCFEALARRQVLVEKGVLPADYPIPEHLRVYAALADGGALV